MIANCNLCFKLIFCSYSIDSIRVLRESEALDASHGSGRGPVRQDDDDSDLSDWDSWEDKEEVKLWLKF